ncbi:MAG TPA: hypothetical protein VNU21_06850 [Usitatibacter sp.]|nr:hypothetical protein [Usitatibacter sp.]
MYIATRCIVRARNRRQTLREASGYVVARRIAHRGKDGASLRENSAKLSVTLTSLPLEKKVASLYRATIYLAFDEGGENLREASAYQLHVRGAGQSVISPEPCAKLQGVSTSRPLQSCYTAAALREASAHQVRGCCAWQSCYIAAALREASAHQVRGCCAWQSRHIAGSLREASESIGSRPLRITPSRQADR